MDLRNIQKTKKKEKQHKKVVIAYLNAKAATEDRVLCVCNRVPIDRHMGRTSSCHFVLRYHPLV